MATSKYVKCSPRVEYEVLRENKVIYKGDNEDIAKAVLESLLRQKKADVYFIKHKRRRYMLLDDEDDLKKLDERNTNKDEKK